MGKITFPSTQHLPALLLASGEDYNLAMERLRHGFLSLRRESQQKPPHRIWIDEALENVPRGLLALFPHRSAPEAKDSNFSWELFTEKINADLNDTYGNFIHRTLTFVNSKFNAQVPEAKKLDADDQKILDAIQEKVDAIAGDLEAAKLQSAANTLISLSRVGNQYLNEKEPWKLLKTDPEKAAAIFYVAVQIVKALAVTSAPFMPSRAQQIWQMLGLQGNVAASRWDEALAPLESGHQIGKPQPLFSKIDADEKKLDDMLQAIRDKKAVDIHQP